MNHRGSPPNTEHYLAKDYLTIDDPPTGAPSTAIPDEVILEASQERPALFGVLVDRYQPPFLRLATRVVRQAEEAEDVVQEAFVKIYRYAKRFQRGQDRKFSSWAYKIVLNTAITHYHKSRRRALELPEGMEPALDESHAAFRELVDMRETEAVIQGVLGEMPEDLRALLSAYYLEDKSYKTITQGGGLTIGALKMKLFRARKLFRKILERSA